VVPGIVITLVKLIVPATLESTISLAILLPYLFLFIATLHISDYVSYRDIFHRDEVHAPREPAS
jgi:hypothetical protein